MKCFLTGREELTFDYRVSIGKGKAIEKLRGILGLLGKVSNLVIAENVYVGRYPMQSASILGYNYSVYKGNYIESQLRVVFRIAWSTDQEFENSRMPLELSIVLLW
ncbi:hypothetical protein TNCV_1722801 [Trichonephila clavipes]|nr:hypothetical protein TNCV_1722801 [Trichonephila clavipes]